MATIKRSLSAKTNPSGRAEFMLRVSVSHSVSHRIKSGVFIKKELFKDGKFSNPRDPEFKREVRDVQDRLDEIEKFLIRICEDTPLNKVTKDFLLTQLDLFLNPPVEETPVAPEVTFFDIFEDYITKKNISEWRIRHLRVLKRALMRYELYIQANGNKRYKIKLDEFNVGIFSKYSTGCLPMS